MLSASHNPYEDNGIKFFAADGYKLSDEAEPRSSARSSATARRRGTSIGARARAARRAARTICASCTRASPSSTSSGLDVLLDCANGATYHVAPEIFRRLGAKRDA